MTGFNEKNGQLHVDEIALSRITQEFGTPSYVYSASHIKGQYETLRSAMVKALPAGRQPLLCYACKASSNIAILSLLKSLGSGLEIVSEGELARGLKAGFDPAKIVSTGIGKKKSEITALLKAGIRQINVESLPELERINSVAGELGKKAPVVLRLNPDVSGGGHSKISTGRKHDKFGLSAKDVAEGFKIAKGLKNIEALGLSMHIGSQVFTVESFKKAFERLPALVKDLRAGGHTIARLDIGGGFPIQYNDEKLLDLDAYASWVRDIIVPLETEIIMEPGRFLVGNSCVLLTAVEYVKEIDDRSFLILDAAMNDLIRPAMYDAWHGIEPVANRSNAKKTYDVVGPVCESSDFFAKDRELPSMKQGDLAVIKSAGAYGASMASNYNTRGLAPEILVDGDKIEVIRKRQTVEDLLKVETIPRVAEGLKRPYTLYMPDTEPRDMPDTEPRARLLLKKLQNARRRAGLILTAERLTAQGWRLLTWILLFAGLWMLQVPDFFGRTGIIAAFFLFFGGIFWLIYKDLRSFHLPDKKEIDRRIEQDSALEHRPLNALNDSLANPRRMNARSLWFVNRHKVIQTLRLIKPSSPRAILAPVDPYAIRFAALLIFVLGIFTAGPDWGSRITNGLTPFSLASDGLSKSGLRLVITPPEYTGLAQLVLEGGQKETIEIPAGSLLKATVHGGLVTPYMNAGGKSVPFENAGHGNFIFAMTAPTGTQLSITQFFIPRASWNYHLVPDTPPQIEMQDGVEISADGSLHIPLSVQDDYGVNALEMHMVLADTAVKPALGKPVSEMRAVLSGPKAVLDIKPTYDLTWHPWAGLPVKITFTGEDHPGQKSAPETLEITLPERSFSHPVAKQLIALRKSLITNPLDNYEAMVDQVETILGRPDDFRRDNVVLLSLQAAASRLYWSGPSIETAEGVAALLWDTALKIEDGNLSIAARNLRDAQNALENALRDPNATSTEIAQLAQNLRMAMAEYFTELQREIQKRIAEGQPLPFIPSAMMKNMIDPDMLAALMDQMESQIMSGDRKSAQELLSQLEGMMDTMSPTMVPMPEDMKQMIQSAKELQELISRQQELLDQTRAQANLKDQTSDIQRNFGEALPTDPELVKRWGLEDMPPPPDAPQQMPDNSPVVDTKDSQKDQEFLRFTLGQLMLKAAESMGQIPETMGAAEQEMRGSSNELWNNQPALSAPHQEEAIRLLKDARKQIQEALAARFKQITGIAFGSGMKYDPLGRPYGDDPGFGSSVKIPDEAERKQAQEILRLLRKRSGELDRPDPELEYYRRLLKQF